MTYPVVDMNTALKDVKRQIAEAQHADAYRGSEAKYDRLVVDTLEPLLDRSVRVIDDFHAFVDEKYALAKQFVDEMETTVKKAGKSISQSEVGILETSARNLVKLNKSADDANKSVSVAVSNFREGTWFEDWGALLDDKSAISRHAHLSMDKINEGKPRAGFLQRTAEYCQRAEALVAAARHTAGQAGQDAASEVVAFGAYTKEVERDLSISARKSDAGIKSIRQQNPKQKPDPAQLKLLQSQLANLQQEAKKVRGMVKTLEIKTASFKKVAAGFDALQRQSAAGALRTAATVYKNAQVTEKALAKSEAEAGKLFQTIAKLK